MLRLFFKLRQSFQSAKKKVPTRELLMLTVAEELFKRKHPRRDPKKLADRFSNLQKRYRVGTSVYCFEFSRARYV